MGAVSVLECPSDLNWRTIEKSYCYIFPKISFNGFFHSFSLEQSAKYWSYMALTKSTILVFTFTPKSSSKRLVCFCCFLHTHSDQSHVEKIVKHKIVYILKIERFLVRFFVFFLHSNIPNVKNNFAPLLLPLSRRHQRTLASITIPCPTSASSSLQEPFSFPKN